jgi:ADP-heptose:LPS heptosyltransferase
MTTFGDLADRLGRFDVAIDLRAAGDTRPALRRLDARYRAGLAMNPEDAVGLDLAIPIHSEARSIQPDNLHPHATLRANILVEAVIDALRPAPHPAAAIWGGVEPVWPGAAPRRPYLVLAPGASAPTRHWPVDRLAQAARRLAAPRGLAVVILGASEDTVAGDQLTHMLGDLEVLNLAGETPTGTLPAIIAGARLFIGMDSGPSHLAASLGTPTVTVLSGAARQGVWRPLGPLTLVARGHADCSPCYLIHRSQCPHDLACLRAVTVDDVTALGEELLAGEGRP